MKIKAIEPTPSPNTMKVILNEVLPSGRVIIIQMKRTSTNASARNFEN